jgi:hypothetical protein
MDSEQSRRALIERGSYEAAAMVAADVEAQALEEDQEHDDNVVRASFGARFVGERPEGRYRRMREPPPDSPTAALRA